MIYKVGELFSGIGGIGLGFKQAGFQVAWANELDAKACLTQATNFNHLIINKNMQDVDPTILPNIDVLTAGFPCQAFSVAGYRKGFEDDRGNLFFDILRYIDALKPRVVFLENVKNIITHDKGNTFKRIQEELHEAGYCIRFEVLNTANYSEIPQNRERIYIVCFKHTNLLEHFSFPEKIDSLKPIHSLLESRVDKAYSYEHTKYYEQLKQSMTNPDTIYQWRRIYIRENKSNLCPTLTANMGTGGHNVPLVLDRSQTIRKLTPRECLRFQGFPDDFILPSSLANAALYKQIGNSVSVPVVRRIAEKIFVSLQQVDSHVF